LAIVSPLSQHPNCRIRRSGNFRADTSTYDFGVSLNTSRGENHFDDWTAEETGIALGMETSMCVLA
jgi:hypothetical protein